jgi:hypothetical protein
MSEQSGSPLRSKAMSLGALALAVPLLVGALVLPRIADASVRPAAVPPPAGRFIVQSINGTGCRAADTQVKPNGMARIDVNFGALQARQGGGAAVRDQRKSCLVTVRAAVGRGYSFGLDSYVLAGHASLLTGATGTASAQSWFVGQPLTASVDRNLPGPYIADWDLRRVVRPASIVWMPCGAGTPLNLQVAVRTGGNPGTTGQISLDALNGQPSASYHFAWKRC